MYENDIDVNLDSIEVNKDLNAIDPKIEPFNITGRQIFSVSIAGILSFILWNLIKKVMGDTEATQFVQIAAVILVTAPLILVGWLKPYGIKMETFFKEIFLPFNTKPQRRLYKTENKYEKELRELKNSMTEEEWNDLLEEENNELI